MLNAHWDSLAKKMINKKIKMRKKKKVAERVGKSACAKDPKSYGVYVYVIYVTQA